MLFWLNEFIECEKSQKSPASLPFQNPSPPDSTRTRDRIARIGGQGRNQYKRARRLQTKSCSSEKLPSDSFFLIDEVDGKACQRGEISNVRAMPTRASRSQEVITGLAIFRDSLKDFKRPTGLRRPGVDRIERSIAWSTRISFSSRSEMPL